MGRIKSCLKLAKKEEKGELLGSTQGGKSSSEERLQELGLLSLEKTEGIPLIP